MKISLIITRVILSFIALSLVTVGALAVIQHWNFGQWMLGAGVLLTIAIFIQAGNQRRNLLAICRALLIVTAGGTLIYGTLFFIQNWQGGAALLSIGLPLSVLLLFDILVTKKVF